SRCNSSSADQDYIHMPVEADASAPGIYALALPSIRMVARAVVRIYDSATSAWVGACIVPPPQPVRDAVDSLVTSLKGAGIWSKIAVLSVFWVHDEQAARLNLRAPGLDVGQLWIAVNSPDFVAYCGFKSDDATSYLELEPEFSQLALLPGDCTLLVYAV